MLDTRVDLKPLTYYIRGLSQKVMDFLYNRKTTQSIAIKFNSGILPLFLHYHVNFEGKISNTEVCALIIPAIGH